MTTLHNDIYKLTHINRGVTNINTHTCSMYVNQSFSFSGPTQEMSLGLAE